MLFYSVCLQRKNVQVCDILCWKSYMKMSVLMDLLLEVDVLTKI